MNKEEFFRLIKRGRYHVFLFSSPLPLPAIFVSHTWIVTARKGKLTRWEGWDRKKLIKKSYGYIYSNLFKDPTVGVALFPFSRYPRWQGSLVNFIEGKRGSIAEKIVMFMNLKARAYPFAFRYLMIPGPNSNTFVQWVLNHFPDSGLKLPWNAFGKNYLG